MESIWNKTTAMPSFPPLTGDTATDVLIIGGGMVGLLCAYQLTHAGVDCLLVEAGRIMGRTSGNTTAKLTAQHGLIYQKLLREFGLEQTRMYLEANLQALKEYHRLGEIFPCDLETRDNYVYATNRHRLLREMDALRRMGYAAELQENVPLPVFAAGAVKFPHQAQFHPMKFAAGIAKDLPIREQTAIQSYDGDTICTNRGHIHAKHIIVATHFPIFNKHGAYYLKQYQHRSYVLALKNAPVSEGMYVDADHKGMSFRSWGEYLLLGGGGHRTGKSGGGWAELRSFAAKYYPHAKETAHWAAQDCMSLDGAPYIGHYGKRTSRLYVATGFNKWGMTGSMVAALLLKDLITEQENPYAAVFDPRRTILHPQLLCNAIETTKNLLTPTRPRCPHLGCALKWNPQEHSWDCPCHGSRFSGDGSLLDTPSTGCLHVPKNQH